MKNVLTLAVGLFVAACAACFRSRFIKFYFVGALVGWDFRDGICFEVPEESERVDHLEHGGIGTRIQELCTGGFRPSVAG